MVAATLNLARFFARESCGWCTPCRDGLQVVVWLLEEIEAGRGSQELIATLLQTARTYIYTTALPPAVAAATRASLRVMQDEPWRRERVLSHVARFRREAAGLGLRLLESATPIQPVVLGSEATAVAASSALRARGLWVPAIRPPTVPAGSSRLRVTFSAAHTDADVDLLVDALAGLHASVPEARGA